MYNSFSDGAQPLIKFGGARYAVVLNFGSCCCDGDVREIKTNKRACGS